MNARLPIAVLLAVANLAIQAKAETQCIRHGNDEIILFDDVRKYCPPQIAPVDPTLGWKKAYSDDHWGCWRIDEVFVYVALESRPTSIHSPGKIEPLAACKKFSDQQVEATWESMLSVCLNLDIDSMLADEYGHKALAIAERYGEADPRLLQSIDCVVARTANLVEAEVLVERANAIRQRLGLNDYEGVVSSLSSIGHIRSRQGRFDAAETAYLEAIKVGRQHLGDDHLEVAALTLLLGKMYFDLGKYPQAEEKLLLALATAEKPRPTYGITAHQIAASAARLLAGMYQAQNNGVEAVRYSEVWGKHKDAAKQSPSQEVGGPNDDFEGA